MNLASSAEGFLVRPADGEDEMNYVKKTWLREYAEESTRRDAVQCMRCYHADIEACLERSAVSIAYRPSIPTRICGFAVTAEDIIHFVFVRGRWRRMGVAKLLLAPLLDKPAEYTHSTIALSSIKLPEAWMFNPEPFLRTE